MKNRILRFLLVAIAAAVLAFIAGSIVSPIVFETPEFLSSIGGATAPVAVPDVVGKSRQDAQRLIESSSLVLAGQWSEYGPFETMGQVIRQDPPSGAQLPRGAPVNIFWNIGPLFRYYQPDSLLGMRATEAEELIADWQLYTAGRSRVPHPVVPEGYVISASPWLAGSLTVSTPVRLLVSTGWSGIPVLTGSTIAEAESLLTAKGLHLLVIENRAVIDPGLEDRIIEQTPNGGESYGSGDTVRVVIGRSMNSEWGEW